MITWEECILEDSVAAEFPMDLLSPASDDYNNKRVFYWDQNLGQAIYVPNQEDRAIVPLYEVLNKNAKEVMESAVDHSFDYQGVEVIRGNKKGLGVFEKYSPKRKI